MTQDDRMYNVFNLAACISGPYRQITALPLEYVPIGNPAPHYHWWDIPPKIDLTSGADEHVCKGDNQKQSYKRCVQFQDQEEVKCFI